MSKSKIKFPITNRFLHLKKMYKDGNTDMELFDSLSTELIQLLGELTFRGIKEIEGEKVDKWKDRVWNLIENAGFLPEYKDEDVSNFQEIIDTWYEDHE
jgi:hypothetical protein